MSANPITLKPQTTHTHTHTQVQANKKLMEGASGGDLEVLHRALQARANVDARDSRYCRMYVVALVRSLV